jgi:ubiquinone/menaquinone biosynthesis C-methylase UbiE
MDGTMTQEKPQTIQSPTQPQQPQVTPERIMQMAWGYAPPLILEAAIQHKVFDVLDAAGGSGLMVEQVAQRTGASLRGLRMLLDALVGLQLLGKDAQQRYTITPESAQFLVTTKPSFVAGIYKHISTQLMPKWMQLSEIVRTGKPAESVNREDRAAFFEQFVEDIFPMSYPATKVLAKELKLAEKPAVRVLDLASGSGVWGIGLAQANPKTSVTAVDWEPVLKVTRRVAAKHGVGGQFAYVAGDVLKVDLGRGHDVATLGHILHSEGEPRSRALLKRVYEALAPGGTIAIAEWLPNEQRTAPPNALIFAVNMLVNTDVGDTFTFNEIASWLRDAGFTDARTLEAPGPSPLILATKPKA